MRIERPKWLSFHLHMPWPGNEYLGGFLPPLLAALEADGQLGRFFFIRYAEGGYHLRLRLRTTPATRPAAVAARLAASLEDFRRAQHLAADAVRCVAADYSRAAHYFGETRESVYAELVNEQTSRLSLQMLAAPEPGPNARLVRNLASVYWLMALATAGRDEYERFAAECAEFAARHKTDDYGAENPFRAILPALSAVVGRTAQASGRSPHLGRAARLLKRLRSRDSGRFAAVHAVHLYCNKLGLSLTQEAAIYPLLAEVTAAAGRPA